MILSPDHLMYDADGTYYWSGPRVISAWQWVSRAVEEHLPRYQDLVLLVGVPGSGKSTWLAAHEDPNSLYVDATFVFQATRRPFIEMAAKQGKLIQAICLCTPWEVCMERNNLRPPDRQVPFGKMVEFHGSLQQEPPTKAEGFASVIRVA